MESLIKVVLGGAIVFHQIFCRVAVQELGIVTLQGHVVRLQLFPIRGAVIGLSQSDID